ncbi:MAG: universal stress protein [Gammaproteobacteria bacterium]
MRRSAPSARACHVARPSRRYPRAARNAPETMPTTVHEVAENTRRLGARLLQECESKAAQAGIAVGTSLIETPGGPAGEAIVNIADDIGADLIVCGTHGRRGLRRLVMGSDAEHIVRRASVPVLLVRKREQKTAEAE